MKKYTSSVLGDVLQTRMCDTVLSEHEAFGDIVVVDLVGSAHHHHHHHHHHDTHSGYHSQPSDHSLWHRMSDGSVRDAWQLVCPGSSSEATWSFGTVVAVWDRS